MRKNRCSLPMPVMAVLSLILLAPRGVGAQEADQQEAERTISFGAEADINSSYIWRGIRFNEGLLVQPSAWISSHGVTFTCWANIVASDKDPLVKTGLNEIDLILEYGITARNLEITPSFAYYHYPEDQSVNTGELAVKAVLPVGPISLATDQIVDVMEYQGAYFGDLGIEYEREINSELSFSVSSYLGWASSKFNESYVGLSRSVLNYGSLGISLPYYVVESMYLTPHAELYYVLDEELREYLDESLFNFGLSVGFEF